MKVSIITICYNNEKQIKNTIDSVVNQTYDNIEYIIVDGASKDGTLGIVKSYGDKISKIISEPDKGIYDAINKGLKSASGKIVGMIHAGDKLHDERVIEDIVMHFQKYNPDIIYGNSKIIDSNGKINRVNKSPEFSKKLIKYGWMPSHQSIYLRRDLLDDLGYYRLDLGGIADYEWFIRWFYVSNLNVKRIDRFVIFFGLGGISTKSYKERLTNKSKNVVKQCWHLNGIEPPFGIVYFKLIRKIKQFLLAYLYRYYERKNK